MAIGDHCSVWGCSNNRRYPEKQVILPHVALRRFYSPRTLRQRRMWDKLIDRKNLKVTENTKACSNHFSAGYRSEDCPYSTLYTRRYEAASDKKRPAPRDEGKLTPTRAKTNKIKKPTRVEHDAGAEDPAKIHRISICNFEALTVKF